MITELSILIPVYNDNATRLVSAVSRQAQSIDGLSYEIVVFDDGSTDEAVKAVNRGLEELPCVRIVEAIHHPCRSAMRNAMSREGRYAWRLMIDVRLTLVYDDFLLRYLSADVPEGGAAVGGVCVDGGKQSGKLYSSNLRFRYEKFEQRHHSEEARVRRPYSSFRTTNFFFHHSVLERVAYDERIIGYGYEDVLLGKALEKAGIRVVHIDNPVAYTHFEDNRCYLSKLEEALRTLREFASELRGYSPLLAFVERLSRWHVQWLFRNSFRLLGGMEYANLCGRRPKLWVLRLYKVGYFLSLR